MALLITACESSSVTTLEDSHSDSGAVDPVEYTERVVRCIRTGGAEVDSLSNITFVAVAGPGMTEEAMAALVAGCWEEAGPAPEITPDPDRARRDYAAHLEIYDCLIDLGYQPESPPSEEMFVEQYGSSHEVGWQPYIRLSEQFGSIGEQLEAEEKCPPWLDWTG